MGDMDPKNWPVRTKQTAVERAWALAGLAAVAVRDDLAGRGERPSPSFTEEQCAAYALFLVQSPGVAGDALFRWAGARALHELGADTFDGQPPAVRLAFNVFAATFHATVQVFIDELVAYEARRTAAIMAPLQRTPIRDTIFETDKDDGPFHHMGPRGSFTPPPPRGQAEAAAFSVAGTLSALAAGELGVGDPASPRPDAAARSTAHPLTTSPSGDPDLVVDRDPGPIGGLGPAPQGVSSPTGAPATDQPPAPISSARKRRG